MTSNKSKITLRLDYLQGPIWISDAETGQPLTGYDEIDNNPEIARINLRCQNVYNECYELDEKNKMLSFNENKLEARRDEILELVASIKSIILEFGVNKYGIEDMITSSLK